MLTINRKLYPTYEFNEIDINEYHGFIYVTVNKVNGKKYVGQKTWGGRNPKTYLGSGEYFGNAVKKHGRENFERYIIDLAEDQGELDDKETWYINEAFGVNTAKSPIWYNCKDGAQNGGNAFAGRTEEANKKTRKKQSKIKKQQYEDNPEYGKSVSLAVKELWKDEEYRKMMIEHHTDISGENNPMYGKGYLISGEKHPLYGKHHKEESKQKLSKTRIEKGLAKGENNPNYGKKKTDNHMWKGYVYGYYQGALKFKWNCTEDCLNYFTSNGIISSHMTLFTAMKKEEEIKRGKLKGWYFIRTKEDLN